MDDGNEETLKLIDIWGEDAMVEGSKRNKEKVAGKMTDAGYDKTADQYKKAEIRI